MMDVFVTGDVQAVSELLGASAGVLREFRFTDRPLRGAVPLCLATFLPHGLFRVQRDHGVVVSILESEGIARYLGLPRGAYLLLCSVLGLTQWRALALNPLLEPEDFAHDDPPHCVFATQPTLQHYALSFEKRFICPACRDFFRCLGAEGEILALQDLLRACPVAC